MVKRVKLKNFSNIFFQSIRYLPAFNKKKRRLFNYSNLIILVQAYVFIIKNHQ